jgi:glutamine amidotransferase
MSFNQPVRPSLSFRGFRQRGKDNKDGWGIAFYPDRAAQIFKEPRKAHESPLSKFIRDYPNVKSKIFIAHVRLGSRCGVAYMNTHPFSRELNGKEYTFAHNGTLSGFEKLPTGRFRKIGCTDSEVVFCHILSCIEEKGITHWTDNDLRWLAEKLIEINSLGTLNCIFSDGEYLFCYYDKNCYSSLYFVQRKAPFSTVRLVDEDFEINLAEEKEETQRGFIIATKPLTDERWENFHPGELIVFRDGDIIFSSSGRNIEQYSTPINENELKY